MTLSSVQPGRGTRGMTSRGLGEGRAHLTLPCRPSRHVGIRTNVASTSRYVPTELRPLRRAKIECTQSVACLCYLICAATQCHSTFLHPPTREPVGGLTM